MTTSLMQLAPTDLASLAASVYGPRWQSPLARDMEIAIRTVQRWARAGIERATTADSVRRFLEERRRLMISAPPADGYADRDDDAYDEFRPRVEALVQAGTAAGWHPAEIMTAVLAVTIDIIRANADDTAAIETLQNAITEIAQSPQR